MKAVVLLMSGLVMAYTQQCHQEMRPVTVCDDGSSISQSGGGGGQKGSVGYPGKSGPPGAKGRKGEAGGSGEKGIQGESCALGLFESETRRKFSEIEKLLTPASCLTSSVYGRQTLRSGEEAFCDGGWTVFQRRFDGSVDFLLNWNQYKNGFGNMSGEFWLGLDKIHQLTHGRGCKLRVDLWDFSDDHAFAEYNSFLVGNESDLYRLHVAGYSGTAGDSLTTSDSTRHDGRPFSARDRDNDAHSRVSCSTKYGRGSGGWWFNACFRSALNAAWGWSEGNAFNIIWNSWKGNDESLKATSMKLRCD